MKVFEFLKFKSNLKANVVVYLCTMPTVKTLLQISGDLIIQTPE